MLRVLPVLRGFVCVEGFGVLAGFWERIEGIEVVADVEGVGGFARFHPVPVEILHNIILITAQADILANQHPQDRCKGFKDFCVSVFE